MRKAILITLVLAVLALFAVGCQQQPQAGRAFGWDPAAYDTGIYEPKPYYPEPLPGPIPGGEIAYADEAIYKPAVTDVTISRTVTPTLPMEICVSNTCPSSEGTPVTITACIPVPPDSSSQEIGDMQSQMERWEMVTNFEGCMDF